MTVPHDTPELVRQLGQVPLFQGLTADVLARIRGQAHSKAIGPGKLFFNEGDHAEAAPVARPVCASAKTRLLVRSMMRPT
jgi:hypothetical protein